MDSIGHKETSGRSGVYIEPPRLPFVRESKFLLLSSPRCTEDEESAETCPQRTAHYRTFHRFHCQTWARFQQRPVSRHPCRSDHLPDMIRGIWTECMPRLAWDRQCSHRAPRVYSWRRLAAVITSGTLPRPGCFTCSLSLCVGRSTIAGGHSHSRCRGRLRRRLASTTRRCSTSSSAS